MSKSLVGVDCVSQDGKVYIIDGNGKALLSFDPQAAEMFVIRFVNAIRKCKGQEPIEKGSK